MKITCYVIKSAAVAAAFYPTRRIAVESQYSAFHVMFSVCTEIGEGSCWTDAVRLRLSKADRQAAACSRWIDVRESHLHVSDRLLCSPAIVLTGGWAAPSGLEYFDLAEMGSLCISVCVQNLTCYTRVHSCITMNPIMLTRFCLGSVRLILLDVLDLSSSFFRSLLTCAVKHLNKTFFGSLK